MEDSSKLNRVEPSKQWPHYKLWSGVRDALKALPAHFHSDTFIEGINATDIFTLNSALGATIENQVVETLNLVRGVWDPSGKYGTYVFCRQPQSFPDVVLRNLSDETEQPLMGIELKGWYLLAKEGEPSMRFQQTEQACAEADLIMIVPWTLNSVISGRPKIYTPYIESARYAAQFRNRHWKEMRGNGPEGEIIIPEGASPYPRKADATNDSPKEDKGGNFGRIARTGLMDEYLSRMRLQPICGIMAKHWLEFFKIFHQDATEVQIRKALENLRAKATNVSWTDRQETLLRILDALEAHFEALQ